VTVSESRQARVGRNEVLFREVNERIKDLSPGAGTEAVDFLCECADRGCTRPVSLTVPEYEAVRAEAEQFLVLPGHEELSAERVVLHGERFFVVAKIGIAGEIAVAHDPRA
jgi:hypothetical protein